MPYLLARRWANYTLLKLFIQLLEKLFLQNFLDLGQCHTKPAYMYVYAPSFYSSEHPGSRGSLPGPLQ